MKKKHFIIHFCIHRYKEISHRTSFNNMACLGEDNSKSTIRQFFSSITCITCGEQTNKEVCPECLSQPSRTILTLLQKIGQLERNQQQITAVRIKKKKKT